MRSLLGFLWGVVIVWYQIKRRVWTDRIIIEAKRSKKASDMDKDLVTAIDQIVTEKYMEGLYGYTQILCYGVAFFQKQAKVKRLYSKEDIG